MGLKKRSFSLSGHRTSVALEEEFWAVLETEAKNTGRSLAGLIKSIDETRGTRASGQCAEASRPCRRAAPISNLRPMITLFHAPKSRSSRFIFLLEELGAPYEIKIVTIRRGDGSGALDAGQSPSAWQGARHPAQRRDRVRIAGHRRLSHRHISRCRPGAETGRGRARRLSHHAGLLWRCAGTGLCLQIPEDGRCRAALPAGSRWTKPWPSSTKR